MLLVVAHQKCHKSVPLMGTRYKVHNVRLEQLVVANASGLVLRVRSIQLKMDATIMWPPVLVGLLAEVGVSAIAVLVLVHFPPVLGAVNLRQGRLRLLPRLLLLVRTQLEIGLL